MQTKKQWLFLDISYQYSVERQWGGTTYLYGYLNSCRQVRLVELIVSICLST
jgi:hypothetical protein